MKERSAEQTGNLVLGTAIFHARTIWLQVLLSTGVAYRLLLAAIWVRPQITAFRPKY